MIIYIIYSMRYVESMPFLRIDNVNHRINLHLKLVRND